MTTWLALNAHCGACHSDTPHRTPSEFRDIAKTLPPDMTVTHFICQHEIRPRVRCRAVVLLRAADYAHAYPAQARAPEKPPRPPRLNTSASRWLNAY